MKGRTVAISFIALIVLSCARDADVPDVPEQSSALSLFESKEIFSDAVSQNVMSVKGDVFFDFSEIVPMWSSSESVSRVKDGRHMADRLFDIRIGYRYLFVVRDTIGGFLPCERKYLMRPELVVSKDLDSGGRYCYVRYDVDLREGRKCRIYVSLSGDVFALVQTESGHVAASMSSYAMGRAEFDKVLVEMYGDVLIRKMKTNLSTKLGGELRGSICIGDRNLGGGSGSDDSGSGGGGDDGNDGGDGSDPNPDIPSGTTIPDAPNFGGGCSGGSSSSSRKVGKFNIKREDGQEYVKEERDKIAEFIKNLKLSALAGSLMSAIEDDDINIFCVDYDKVIHGVPSYAWYVPGTRDIYYNTKEHNYPIVLLEEMFHYYQKRESGDMSLPDMEFEAKCYIAMVLEEGDGYIRSPNPDDIWVSFRNFVNNPDSSTFNTAAGVLGLRISPNYAGAIYKNATLENYEKLK